MTNTPSAVPGWYPDAQGEMRYWDGHVWTEFTAGNYPHEREREEPPYSVGGAIPVVQEITKRPWTRRWQFWLVIACVTFVGIGAIGNATTPDSTGDSSNRSADKAEPIRASEDPTPTTEPTEAPIALLFITDQKDGDSWVASDGKEYRLGLINTPERSEKCGAEASAFTRAFLSSGFAVDAYTTDTHGRSVAEVFDKTGKSLNVALAKSGLGNDRYLEEFRHENDELARRLDSALATAATPDCKKVVAPAPLVSKPSKAPKPATNCMSGYTPCLPIVADLDCGEIGHPVTVTGSDPYRLDRDGDGTGCD